jgi:putative holliday junction resolvase
MRYLGIDFGMKRVGLALSDEEGRIAFPHSVVPNGSKLIDAIAALCREKEVATIVLGESRDFKGEPNAIFGASMGLKEGLERELGIPVLLEPEFMTSAQAERQGQTEFLDASAAAIILQSYLDKKTVDGRQ